MGLSERGAPPEAVTRLGALPPCPLNLSESLLICALTKHPVARCAFSFLRHLTSGREKEGVEELACGSC